MGYVLTTGLAVRRMLVGGMIAASLLLTGCASTYVDTATKEVPQANFKKIAQPKPVRLNFEFQTNGAPNGQATNALREMVTAQVKESGLFGEFQNASSSTSGILSVVLNNAPITKDAAQQGFVTGLTFGLAGSAVTDGYVCTVSYLPPGQAAPIVVNARHAIHTTMGNANAPTGAVKSSNVEEAVRTMTRQVLSNALNDLSTNTSFN